MKPSFLKTRTQIISLLLIAGLTLGTSSLVGAQEQTTTFTDVSESHRYYHSIEALSQDGIIQGFPIGTFLPDRPVNRVEALKIILESFPQTSQENELEIPPPVLNYSDVDNSAWYYPYIEQATTFDIIQGYEDNTFRPGDTINLVETLKMIVEAVETDPLQETITPEIPLGLDIPLDSWFAKYVQYGLAKGMLFPNSEENILPSELVTRGQLTDLIFRLKTDYYSGMVYHGNATYYADMFDGHGTASGETFDQTKLTAAHPLLPFGTKLRVTNQRTGDTTEVTVNDRGPYGDHAIIDLSKAAFEAIGHLGSGIIPVEIEIIYNENEPT